MATITLPRVIWRRLVLSGVRAAAAQPGALSLCRLSEPLPAGSRPVPEYVLPLHSPPQPHLTLLHEVKQNKIHMRRAPGWRAHLSVWDRLSWHSLFNGVTSQHVSGTGGINISWHILFASELICIPSSSLGCQFSWTMTNCTVLSVMWVLDEANGAAVVHVFKGRKPRFFFVVAVDRNLV